MRLKEKTRLVLLITILTLAFFSFSPAQAYASTVSDISSQLICQCGCASVLNNCTHAECGSREEMTALIQQKIDQGQSEEQITQFFVTQYGEQVLSAPTKRGFNLMVWITPFAALLLGGLVAFIMLRDWVRRGLNPTTPAPTKVDEGDDKYRRRLKQELGELTERSFR
ncbi:cytochrome c-type biogenesis protein CcmH [Chloroflexota bacterium]